MLEESAFANVAVIDQLANSSMGLILGNVSTGEGLANLVSMGLLGVRLSKQLVSDLGRDPTAAAALDNIAASARDLGLQALVSQVPKHVNGFVLKSCG